MLSLCMKLTPFAESLKAARSAAFPDNVAVWLRNYEALAFLPVALAAFTGAFE